MSLSRTVTREVTTTFTEQASIRTEMELRSAVKDVLAKFSPPLAHNPHVIDRVCGALMGSSATPESVLGVFAKERLTAFRDAANFVLEDGSLFKAPTNDLFN